MSCTLTVNGRTLVCKDAIGGIRRVWIKKFDAGDWGTPSSGGLAGAAVAITVYPFELTKNSGSFVQTINSSVENGTVFFEQVVTIQYAKIRAIDNSELSDLLKNRICIIVEDVNGNRMVMGHTSGCESNGGSISTGTAPGDLNGYNLTFVSHELVPAPILSAVTNITYGAAT